MQPNKKTARFSNLSRLQRFALYGASFITPPLTVAILTLTSNVSTTLLRKAPEPLALPLPPSPSFQPPLPIALIVLSNTGSQLREVLSAASALNASHRYRIITAAPERILSATTGEISILPDYSFADVARLPTPKLLILPSVLDPQMPKMSEFVSHIAPLSEQILTLGEGIRLLLSGGAHSIAQGKKATTHSLAMDELKRSFPEVKWLSERIVRDGNLVSSNGVASTEDAVFELLHPQGPFNADNSQPSIVPPRTALAPLFWHAAYDWDQPKVGVLLRKAVEDGPLGQILDLYPRTFSYKTVSVSPTREWIQTAAGLTVVANIAMDQLKQVDQVIIPPTSPPARLSAASQEWILKTGAETVSLPSDLKKLDADLLSRISEQRPEVAQAAAYLIGSSWRVTPTDPARSIFWSLFNGLLVRPFLLGCLGLLLMRLFLITGSSSKPELGVV